jgi:hypothetical protein
MSMNSPFWMFCDLSLVDHPGLTYNGAKQVITDRKVLAAFFNEAKNTHYCSPLKLFFD